MSENLHQLKEWHDLFEKGIISQEEYENKKREILNLPLEIKVAEPIQTLTPEGKTAETASVKTSTKIVQNKKSDLNVNHIFLIAFGALLLIGGGIWFWNMKKSSNSKVNAQSLYNKHLYGLKGKIKHVTSYLYENEDFTKKTDSTSYKSKTISLFNEQGELIETKRDIKSSNQFYTFKSKYISNKDQVLQLRYDMENKLTDSISYSKINNKFWKIYGKQVGSQIITFGEQVLDDFGRDLSSKYTDYENQKVIETFSYENILENNLIVKTVTRFDNKEIVEFYEYSNFDENNNPKKIVIFGHDKKKVEKIIIREFTYY